MKTIFNKEDLKITVSENGGLVDYNYEFFKEGFEEWATDLKMLLPDAEELKIYLRECGYNVKSITE